MKYLKTYKTFESAEPFLTTSSKGEPMHSCVGAIIINNGKALMIDRAKFPFGWACIAGHIDGNETPEQALIREIKEESGYDAIDYELLFEEEIENPCSRGIKVHYWYVYKVNVEGEIVKNVEETKNIDWIDIDKIKELKMEPVWDYILKKVQL